MGRLRETIIEQAAKLECIDDVSGLPDVQAIRFLQHKEGYVPCFRWSRPLRPGGGHPDGCAEAECLWKTACDGSRRAEGKLAFELRDYILEKAYGLGCIDEVFDLSDSNAIRFLQQREGFAACYAGDVPLQADPDDPERCNVSDCYWSSDCNSYRTFKAARFDAVLSSESHQALRQLQTRIVAFEASKDALFSDGGVGLQIRSFRHLPSATRKMLVAAPKTVVGETTDGSVKLAPYLLSSRAYPDASTGTYSSPGIRHEVEVLFTGDIMKLKEWLLETDSFLQEGNLAYYPLVKKVSQRRTFDRPAAVGRPVMDYLIRPSLATDLETFEAPYVGLPEGEIMLTEPEFAPILNLELPVLEEVEYETLFKLMSDNPEELCTFREYLHASVEEMREAVVGSVDFGRDCRRIERNIRDHVRKLDSDFKKAKMKAAITVSGCAVASWTLALYCILQGTGDVMTILGPGAVVYKASEAYADYLTQRLALKDDPAYFLWLLGKTKRRN